jgi:uncharacterized membrane protein
MEQVFEYEIPVLHPIAVHFPIALLLVLAGIVCLWAALDRDALVRWAAWVAVIATAAALVAERTGEAMEEQSSGSAIVESLVSLHEQAAEWTTWAAALLAVCLILVTAGDRFWPARAGTPWPIRIGLLLLALFVAALVTWTGHIGGIMVWGVAA